MNRALPAAALLALAACNVKLEGGRCQSDQNCLDDERCDATAGRCVRCVPNPDCAAAGTACSADGSTVRTCAQNAGTCLYLAASVDCAGAAKTCGTRSGAPACECPTYAGTSYYADADSGSNPGAFPYPTGAQAPPDCRFRTLTQALARATASGVAATVSATGAGAVSAAPMVFSKAKGEIFPLAVTPGVTLATTDTPPAPASYVVSIDDANAAAGVDLHEGAALVGVTVQNVAATGVGAAGVRLVCTGGTPPPLIQAVKVDGATTLPYAVSATGACGAQLTGVDAGGAASAALLVNTAATNPAIAVTGGLFHGSKVGILVNQGKVSLTNVEVASNTSASGGIGIRAGNISGAAGDILLSATGLLVHDNDDTGIQLLRLTAQSTASLLSSTVYFNKALTAASTYDAGGARKAGGILLVGSPPGTFTFHNNLVCGNKSDQVGVYWSPGGTWQLNGTGLTTCNVFKVRDTSASGYLVYSTGIAVDATYNSWPTALPGVNDVNAPIVVVPACAVDATPTTCP